MIDPYVSYKVNAGIAQIEFYHPAHNALPGDLLTQIAERLEEAGKNIEVRLIMLRSGGDRTFCAGASFDELKAISNETEGKAFFSGFANVINAIRKNPKLVVARVHGKAVGGGVGLAAAADICFATRFASIRLSELQIGIGPFVIAPAVIRKLGLSEFTNLCLRPTEWMSAEAAKDAGLFSQIFEDSESMDRYLDTYLPWLTSANPEALASLKSVLWEGTEHWDRLLIDRAALSGKLALSEFTINALHKIDKKT